MAKQIDTPKGAPYLKKTKKTQNGAKEKCEEEKGQKGRLPGTNSQPPCAACDSRRVWSEEVKPEKRGRKV